MNPTDEPSDEVLRKRLRHAAALEEPPETIVRAAINLWQTRKPSPLQRTAGAVLRRIEAVLGFDSWAGTPALAVRNVATEARQFVFTTQGRDVDLRIAPASNGRFTITGQVLGPDESGSVRFTPERAGGETAASVNVELDSLGEFRFEDVAAGTWRVAVLVGGDEIMLPLVEVGARTG